jgi:hypothetical protein
MYNLLVILAMHCVPFITSYFDADSVWHAYITTLLIIIVLQNFYIYTHTNRKTLVSLLAFVLLIISIWGFFDYVALSVMG